jgi:hypothetical protein
MGLIEEFKWDFAERFKIKDSGEIFGEVLRIRITRDRASGKSIWISLPQKDNPRTRSAERISLANKNSNKRTERAIVPHIAFAVGKLINTRPTQPSSALRTVTRYLRSTGYLRTRYIHGLFANRGGI